MTLQPESIGIVAGSSSLQCGCQLTRTEGIHHMSKGNEKSSKELASLAGKVLRLKSAPPVAKRLAGSVLTQAPKKPRK